MANGSSFKTEQPITIQKHINDLRVDVGKLNLEEILQKQEQIVMDERGASDLQIKVEQKQLQVSKLSLKIIESKFCREMIPVNKDKITKLGSSLVQEKVAYTLHRGNHEKICNKVKLSRC